MNYLEAALVRRARNNQPFCSYSFRLTPDSRIVFSRLAASDSKDEMPTQTSIPMRKM